MTGIIIVPPRPPATVRRVLVGGIVHRGRRTPGEIVWVLDCDPTGCSTQATPTGRRLTCWRCADRTARLAAAVAQATTEPAG
jgi:hypothetical protein